MHPRAQKKERWHRSVDKHTHKGPRCDGEKKKPTGNNLLPTKSYIRLLSQPVLR